jgi:hypothetical protein
VGCLWAESISPLLLVVVLCEGLSFEDLGTFLSEIIEMCIGVTLLDIRESLFDFLFTLLLTLLTID